MTRPTNTIVVLNLSNFTGMLNHHEGPDGNHRSIRVDYRALLDYVTDGVAPMKAIAVSQRDPKIHRNMDRHHQFLRGLKDFGWDHVESLFDSATRDIASTEQAIIREIYSGLTQTDESTQDTVLVPGFDPTSTDLIFINGTNLWSNVIATLHHDGGFQCKIAFPVKAISPVFASWPVLNLDDFLASQMDRKVRSN